MSVIRVRGVEGTTPEFRRKNETVARALGLDPDWLFTVESFETDGTFRADKRNPYSGATGLIQFTPATAEGMQTTTDDLARMSPVEQLDWVYRYFLPFQGRLRSLDDTYLAVFMPTQMGKSSDSVVAKEGSRVYVQNPGFDRPDAEGNRKGYFTVGDITRQIHAVYNAGLRRGRIDLEPLTSSSSSSSSSDLVGLIVLLAGGWLLWRAYA